MSFPLLLLTSVPPLPPHQAMLVLSTDILQSSLTSPPSHPSSLTESLVHHLPITMASTLDGEDIQRHRQWWKCVYQWLSGSLRYGWLPQVWLARLGMAGSLGYGWLPRVPQVTATCSSLLGTLEACSLWQMKVS